MCGAAQHTQRSAAHLHARGVGLGLPQLCDGDAAAQRVVDVGGVEVLGQRLCGLPGKVEGAGGHEQEKGALQRKAVKGRCAPHRAALDTQRRRAARHPRSPGGLEGERNTSFSRVWGSTKGETARHRMLNSMGGL